VIRLRQLAHGNQHPAPAKGGRAPEGPRADGGCGRQARVRENEERRQTQGAATGILVGERSETRRVLPHLQHAGVDALSDDNSRTAVGAARAGARTGTIDSSAGTETSCSILLSPGLKAATVGALS
jgi:hypothetical protein